MTYYPEDPPFHINRTQSTPIDIVNLSRIEIGLHTGTHIDAPLHFIHNGKNITDLPLEKFYGSCQVIDLSDIEFGEAITLKHLALVESGKIILFKTKNSYISGEEFKEDHIYLDAKGAQFLVERRVKAVGIDYLSIGKYNNDEGITTHQILLKKEIPIYENLDLRSVKGGDYIFIGFPLKIANAEGSPTRAVLINDEKSISTE